MNNNETEFYVPKENNLKYKLIGIGAVAIAGLLLVLILSLLFGGRSYEKTLKKGIEAMFSDKGKADKFIELVSEQEVQVYLSKDKIDKEDMVKQMQTAFDILRNYVKEELGENWKVSFEITDTQDYEKEEVKEYNEKLKKEAEEYKVKWKKVKKMKDVSVEITFKSKNGKQSQTKELDFTVVKIGGSWYLTTQFG